MPLILLLEFIPVQFSAAFETHPVALLSKKVPVTLALPAVLSDATSPALFPVADDFIPHQVFKPPIVGLV